MRVIAGKARSLPLKTIPGMDTRPTTDRTKETLFNMIQPFMADCRFLDLFSGSGAMGIEAISRGAKESVFVEENAKAVTCIKDNLKFTHFQNQGIVMQTDALTALRKLEGAEPFDCVFMDPPYNKELEKVVLEYLQHSNLIEENTLIIVEASLDTDFQYLESIGFTLKKQKKYKTNQHVFIEKGLIS